MPGFEQWMLLLLAAVILVPLAARLGLGAVLGYLIAGVIVGPWGFGVIGQVEEILHVPEFGVILMLFVIGLEPRPTRLWALRKAIFGFGSTQLLGWALLLMGFSMLSGQPLTTAAVVGLVLALSSTAFALQWIAEHDERRLNEYHSVHNDEEKMRELAKEGARELEEMFARDASDLHPTNV